VFFRTKNWGGRLEMLENGMVFTTWITKTWAQSYLTTNLFIFYFIFYILESIKANREKVLLYHYRLGYPWFRIIKQLFPLFFKTLDVESFQCEVCELAKHKCVPFSVNNKMSTFPFYLAHTNIWNPSNVPNISGARWFVTFIDDCTWVTWI